MSLTINAKTYTADAATSANSIPYNGPLMSISVKDRLDLGRVAPKVTSLFSGTARARAKMTRTLALTGAKTTVGDSILDLNASIPVGTAGADIDTLVADYAAYVGSAAFKDLLKKQLLTY